MSEETSAISPVEPDWNVIQERYLDGEPLAFIAADFGLTPGNIATRAWRYRWKSQQFKLVEQNKAEIEREVRGSLVVSVLKEARLFQAEDWPSDWGLRDTASKCRTRLIENAAKLFNWNSDPLAGMKQAKALDV